MAQGEIDDGSLRITSCKAVLSWRVGGGTDAFPGNLSLPGEAGGLGFQRLKMIFGDRPVPGEFGGKYKACLRGGGGLHQQAQLRQDAGQRGFRLVKGRLR